ncbi:hypothetical protein QAD02_009994 [Eretmocerus hayati]|uniref:Uncharacterized protein n=1 Tax=Eretmocerus hayati TaxID=131215 RepID=A0ACC2NB93_9HYME|nr:hypothetical protein QAD02_009994 [Eretmocerus hayati]
MAGAIANQVYGTFIVQLIYTILNWVVFQYVDGVKKYVDQHPKLSEIMTAIYVVLITIWVIMALLDKSMPFADICLVLVTIAVSFHLCLKLIQLSGVEQILITIGITAGIIIVVYLVAVSASSDLTGVMPFNLLAGPWAMVIAIIFVIIYEADKEHTSLMTFAVIGAIFLVLFDSTKYPKRLLAMGLMGFVGMLVARGAWSFMQIYILNLIFGILGSLIMLLVNLMSWSELAEMISSWGIIFCLVLVGLTTLSSQVPKIHRIYGIFGSLAVSLCLFVDVLRIFGDRGLEIGVDEFSYANSHVYVYVIWLFRFLLMCYMPVTVTQSSIDD